MKAEHTTITSRVLGAPADWDATRAKCVGLPVVDTQTGYVSFWRPSAVELVALNAGAFISLLVWSKAHPPVSLEVESVQVSKAIEAEQ